MIFDPEDVAAYDAMEEAANTRKKEVTGLDTPWYYCDEHERYFPCHWHPDDYVHPWLKASEDA